MNGRRLGLLAVLLVYLVGPNPKLGGAQVGDLLLVAFAVGYVATTRPKLHGGLLVLFAAPALVVLLTILGKAMTGAAFGRDEINHLLKVTSLGALATVGASFGLAEGQDGELTTPRRMAQVAIIGIAFTGVLGLLEYAQPNLFRGLAAGVYEMELRTRVSSVEYALMEGRIASIFSWANAFAEFLLFTLTVLVVNHKAVGRLAVLPPLAIGLACLFLTNSRTSMLLFVFMLTYVVVMRRRWGTLVAAGVVALAVVALVPLEALLGPQNAQRLAELVNLVRYGEVPANVETRLITLSYLPSRVLGSPYAYFGFPIALYESTVFLSWDNQYLGFLVKYGLTGTLMALWQWSMVLVPLRILRRRGIADEALRDYLHTLIVLNLMVAIGGLAGDTLFVERWQEFFFAFQGVVLGAALAWPEPPVEKPEAPALATAGHSA